MKDYKLPLLSSDELDLQTSDSDGISSGYESSSEKRKTKRLPKFTRSGERKKRRSEFMQFRSTRALGDSLKYILSMPELCDVTFNVGEDRVPIHGVRAILATRSKVFYQLILKHQRMAASGQIVIPVRKYDPVVFKKLIEFVHCGTVEVGMNSVAGLYCAAEQFELTDLRSACLDYIHRCIRSGLKTELLDTATEYSHHKSAPSLISEIHIYTTHDDTQRSRPHSRESAV